MTDEELTEEYAEVLCQTCTLDTCRHNILQTCAIKESIKQAFLAGLKAGRPKWHKVVEPACGGGAMIIALAEAFYKKDINFQQNLYVEMTDLSWNAVCMSMIHMSLLGIPATIIHGNSISLEVFDVFETPMVGINLIKERLAIQEQEKLVSAEVEPEKVETEIKLNMPLFEKEMKEK